MTFTLLRAADRLAVPWKNGGGITRELAVWPPGASFDDFVWRVSMAEVHQDGPFSSFPGVDRILTLLEGGLRLTVSGAGVFDLSPQTPPLAFDGDAPASAALATGPVLDLNVMTRRGAAYAHVGRWASAADIPATQGACLVFALADGVRVVNARQAWNLFRYDAVLTTIGCAVEASTAAQALIVSLMMDRDDFP